MPEFRMGLSQRIEQRQRLGFEQKQQLQNLLQLELKLRSPEIPEARKGVEGMRVANHLLEERNAVGVLIGGVASEVWKKGSNLESLAQHKDVDVLVFDDSFELRDPFEGGVDWWLPHHHVFEKLVSNYGGRMLNVSVDWFENGFGAKLYYTLHTITDEPLSPGLYIPTADVITSIRGCEVDVALSFSPGVEESDQSVFEAFARKVRAQMTVHLMPELKQPFKKRILSSDFLYPEGVDRDSYVGLSNLSL